MSTGANAQKKRVAILGGTFNPIHNGHLYLIREFARLLELDQVLLMIANIPPHKRTPDLAPGADRLAMARRAQMQEPLLVPCDLELRRRGKSYTFETLRTLCRRHRDTDYYFLMGADMFLTIDQWRRPEEIFHRATLCTAPRDTQSFDRLKAFERHLRAMGARTIVEPLSPPPISSTEIRERIARGEPVDELVPAGVADYIRTHGLYTHLKGGTAD